MKRAIFFVIAAVLGALFGCMMLFAPEKAAEGFGMTVTAENSLLFRILGALILSSGVLNFLVRKHSDNPTLKAVLIFNIMYHGLGMVVDLLGAAQGTLAFDKIIPGQVVHLFIGIGSLIYLMRIKSANA